MEVGEAERLKGLEDEIHRLKHLVVDRSLDKEVLKAILRKNGWIVPIGQQQEDRNHRSNGLAACHQQAIHR
jgi:hypothetical protein